MLHLLFILYLVIIYSYTILWPTGIQYLFIFFSPYIAGHSLFQVRTDLIECLKGFLFVLYSKQVLHDLAYKDVALFRTIYRYVPMYFPTLIIMILVVFSIGDYHGIWKKSFQVNMVFHLSGIFYLNEIIGDQHLVKISISYDNNAATLTRPVTSLARSNSIGTPIVHVDHLV